MAPIRKSVNRPTRRRLLTGAAGAGLAMIAAPAVLRRAAAQSWRGGDPFSLGVAAGAPRPDGFVLWTRLAPEPLSSNPETPGGMSGGDVTVAYEIATDPAMRDIVRRGEATAEQAYGYSVHLDVAGLKSGQPYWYRFMSADAASRIGRAITLPAPGTGLDRLRFGFVSCSNYEHGYFSGYRQSTAGNTVRAKLVTRRRTRAARTWKPMRAVRSGAKPGGPCSASRRKRGLIPRSPTARRNGI